MSSLFWYNFFSILENRINQAIEVTRIGYVIRIDEGHIEQDHIQKELIDHLF